MKSKKPRLEDYYDEFDPRGCTTSEYNKFLKAEKDYGVGALIEEKVVERVSGKTRN